MPTHEPFGNARRGEDWVAVGNCACVAFIPADELEDYARATHWCACVGFVCLLVFLVVHM
ncbi:hypothetical protein [Pseudorhodoferax sp.]|uniref:hypothetical protein n=1 Tax=Pseudorhodoferax sp. TaxID=1993553 RepID=UPI002DD62BB3|nr:hypothetical protein [Pseudorhodoferax sp.]